MFNNFPRRCYHHHHYVSENRIAVVGMLAATLRLVHIIYLT